MTQTATQDTLRFHLADAPWPVDFFSPDDLPGFLDRVYVVESRLAGTGPDLSARIRLAFDGELAIRLPGLDGVSLVFGGDPQVEGVTLIGVRVALGTRREIVFDHLSFAVRFDRSLLTPAPDEAGQVAEHAQIYATGSIAIDDNFDVQVRGFDAIELTPVMLGSSGIVLSASGVKLDLSRTTALPEVLAAGFGEDFLGVFVGEAKVRFPDNFPSLAPEDLALRDARVNRHFDTLYLPSDTARPGRTYRIEEVNQPGHWVRVGHDASNPPPALDGLGRWSIQAGVSGLPVPQVYNLSSNRGYDHYDAVLFLVQGGQIRKASPSTTYTSLNYASYDTKRSSVRGNKDYEYFSYRSGTRKFINFGVKLVDFGAGPRPGINELFHGVREARWYSEAVTRDDTAPATMATVPSTGPGKSAIRFHDGHGAYGTTASESAGCLVSPAFADMRTFMIDRYSAEVQAYQATVSAAMASIAAVDHAGAVTLYPTVASGQWVWIIRPSERPL